MGLSPAPAGRAFLDGSLVSAYGRACFDVCRFDVWLPPRGFGLLAAGGGVMTALHELPVGVPAWVEAVQAPAGLDEWRTRLEELGFLPGEPVRVIARAAPGGDPLAVRIADSTYALRRAEAACVQVRPADAKER